jgi:NAD(P)-dependent dehydrogenase (short-subunit alcohol dehydrogenase family)
MRSLDGRRAVVTGAAGGLGADITRLFAAEGASVLATDVVEAEEFWSRVELDGDGVEYRRLDVTDAEAVGAAFEAVPEIDTLVHCTGIREVQPALELDPEEWRRVLEVNLSGTFFCCQAAGRAMRAGGRGGSIVAMTSVAGMVGVAARPAYSASKAGMIGLVRSMAVEFAEFGVRVNAIAPGQIRTPLTEAYWSDDAFREGLAETIPLGRGGHPPDVSSVALFLASDLAGYVTGTVVPVDGGWVISKSFAVPGAASDAYLGAQSTRDPE